MDDVADASRPEELIVSAATGFASNYPNTVDKQPRCLDELNPPAEAIVRKAIAIAYLYKFFYIKQPLALECFH